MKDKKATDDAYTELNAVAIAPHAAGYVVERTVGTNLLWLEGPDNLGSTGSPAFEKTASLF